MTSIVSGGTVSVTNESVAVTGTGTAFATSSVENGLLLVAGTVAFVSSVETRFRQIPHAPADRIPTMTAHTLLIIEDDDGSGETLFEQIARYEEFRILRVATATEGLWTVRGREIDLVMIDGSLPDPDGREMVKILRRDGFRVPVILLTADGSDADTILGLDAGASDCVIRPFSPVVLLARIRAHLRRHDRRVADRQGPASPRNTRRRSRPV